jgi:hypothetical protein
MWNSTAASLGVMLVAVCAPAWARTVLESSPAEHDQVIHEVFSREVDASAIQPGEHLVLLASVSDGAVVYANGKEVGRINMPDGPVNDKTLALGPLDEKHKGLFVRIRLLDSAIRSEGKNQFTVDVHAATGPAHLRCDLVLKTLPAEDPAPPPDEKARKVLEEFRHDNYIDVATHLPDGYVDGGRHMKLDADDHATSGREILVVDRPHDPELARHLAYARSLSGLPPVERAHKLCLYVDEIFTPGGGRKLLEPTMTELEQEYKNKSLRIGDVPDQFHAGVCRHRSLLFKLLADEAGLKTALVRGNYVHLHGGTVVPHAWNELQLDDGRRYLVDSTLHPKEQFPEITTPEVTSPEIAKRYVKVDRSLFYKASRAAGSN